MILGLIIGFVNYIESYLSPLKVFVGGLYFLLKNLLLTISKQ
ncbi:hypothetical protein SESI111939_19840 [Serratia silvae]